MASPKKLPEDQSRMAELAARFKRGRAIYRDFVWPGSDPPMRCRIRVVSNDETQVAIARAMQRFEKIGLPMTVLTGDELANEIATQVLAMAIEDPARPIEGHYLDGKCEPIFHSGDELREWTTPSERAAVFAEYTDLDQESDPDLDDLDSEEVEALLDAVKKKDESTLKGFGARSLRSFLLGVVSPLLN